jgi:glycine cleavage system pyridoxal-binding protein P
MHPNHFAYRHIGPRKEDVAEMVKFLGYGSLDG